MRRPGRPRADADPRPVQTPACMTSQRERGVTGCACPQGRDGGARDQRHDRHMVYLALQNHSYSPGHSKSTSYSSVAFSGKRCVVAEARWVTAAESEKRARARGPGIQLFSTAVLTRCTAGNSTTSMDSTIPTPEAERRILGSHATTHTRAHRHRPPHLRQLTLRRVIGGTMRQCHHG